MSLFRTSDYKVKDQRVISKKTKIPTQAKSHKVFCRNCNKQNTPTAKICIQCECTMSSKPMRKKMR